MTGAYDDLSQETWNSADDNIPKEYLDAVIAQIDEFQSIDKEPGEFQKLEMKLRERQKREREESERRFKAKYELVWLEFHPSGSYSEYWRPRKEV